jgi:2-polyprenyl-3-methyl-5-hydroxy-6-metoxy-1,4-benzoquinol methylase
MNISQRALKNNFRTIQSYEGYADDYDGLCGEIPSPNVEAALRQLMAVVTPGGQILEVGSGPGREADFIESQGAHVRRTDATKAFLDIQRQRGKHGELLNLLTDDLGGPYDGIMALCVLIHIDRDQTNEVLEKVATALRLGGGFLVSVRDGTGETNGDYHMTYWSRNGFATRLDAAGLRIEWEDVHVDCGGDKWLTFLARRSS